MANKFQIKRTSSTGATPNTTNASNTAYIAPGELAVNMADSKLYTANTSGGLLELGSNLSSLSVTGTATIKAISANGSLGTAAQVLHSNGSAIYWDADNTSSTTYDLTSVANTAANAGRIRLSDSSSANDDVLVVGQGSVTVSSNSTAVYISGTDTNTTYDLATIANTAANEGLVSLTGSNSTTDNVKIIGLDEVTVSSNSTAVYIDHNDVARANNTSSVSPASGGTFTAIDSITTNARGHVTAINTKTVTLPIDPDTNSTYDLLAVANTEANAGRIRLKDSNNANDDVIITGTGTSTVSSNASHIIINSADQYVGTVTSVTGGSGLTGTVTSSGSLDVGAGDGITVNADNVAVTPGTGIVANSTGVHVNAAYIATVTVNSANNADYLDGQHGAYYTNATNLSTGTVPYARIPANIANTTGAFTFSGIHTHSANVVISANVGLSANGSYGTAGQVLHSNGTSVYWAADDNTNTTYDLAAVANTATNTGRIRLTDSSSANDDVVLYGNGATTIWSNTTGVYISSTDTLPYSYQVRPVANSAANEGLFKLEANEDPASNTWVKFIGQDEITVTSNTTAVYIDHNDVARTNNTSSASPASGGTFTAIDSITTNARGHVTAINTKTVTLPIDPDTNTTYDLAAIANTAANEGLISLTGSNSTTDNVKIIGTGGASVSSNSTAVYINAPTNTDTTYDLASVANTAANAGRIRLTDSALANDDVLVVGQGSVTVSSNSTAVYISGTDTNTTYDLLAIANTEANAGRLRLKDSGNANDDVIFAGSGTTTVSSNATHIIVNSADQYNGTVTSVTGGNGLTGTVTTTGSLAVGAGSGITVNADDVAVNPGTGIVANSTGTHVNASYIATVTVNSANNADYLDGQHGAYYTNATNISTGTLAAGRLPSLYLGTTTIQSTSAAQAVTGITTLAAGNTTITGFLSASNLFANGTSGYSIRATTPGSVQGEKSALSLWGTFTGTADNGPRRIADVVGSYVGGNWGNETLTLHVGYGSQNDNANTTIQRLLVNSTSFAANSLAFSGITTLTAQSVGQTKTAPTISAGTLTLDLNAATVFAVSLNANITTLTINNVRTSGTTSSFILNLTADGTARSIAWPTSFKWPGGTAPTITSTLNKTDVIVAFTHDGGTTWYAFISGQNL